MYKMIKTGVLIMQGVAAIVYTAGGEFMHKERPNALCEVLFRPMIEWVNSALDEAGISDRCYVRREGEEALEKYTGSAPIFCREAESGHPAFAAQDWVFERSEKNIIVLCAEAPFVDGDSVKASFEHHTETDYDMTVLASGGRAAFIKELALSAFGVKGAFLLELFSARDPEDRDGEQFVSHALKILSDRQKVAGTFISGRPEINMRAKNALELVSLNAAARTVVFKKLCVSGVDIICTDGIIVEPAVKVGAGTKLLPGTILRGNTEIGENCVIGPNSYIEDSVIGDGTEVNSTQIRSSTLEKNVKIGPFSQVRPGTVIREGCKIGDYVEIKNSDIGARTAVAHLTYIGDSDVGEAVNFGCGCCVANYDGQHKHRTKIGNHAFIGCNTNLIAPVEVGDFGYTAAGSTITKDVPEYALAVERSTQKNIENWVKKHDAIKIK